MPPTLTPVFDAGSRWVAIRANLAAGAQPDAGLLAQLCLATSGDEEGATASSLPLLIRTESPEQWLAVLKNVPLQRPIRLHIPETYFSNPEAQSVLDTLAAQGVGFFIDGAANSDRADCALALDAAQNASARSGSLLHKLKGPHLAYGIASPAEQREFAHAGCQWFEGSWPLQITSTRGQPPASTSRSTLLNLLALVASDADSHEIEALLKHDPNLCFQLLKLVNSVSFSLTHKISSFTQAITLLGRRQLQRWLQLLMYAGHHGDNSASPLLGIVAQRAALMEALVAARNGTQADKDRAFMTGLFSLLDILLNAPIVDLVTPLNLEASITRALVAREGTLGRLLDLAIAAASPPDSGLADVLAELEVTPDAFMCAQRQAIAWAARISREM